MKRSLMILTLAILTGCATSPRPTPEQIKAEQDAENQRYIDRYNFLTKLATNKHTGEVDLNYMNYLLLTDPIIGLYRGPAVSSDTPTTSTAPSGGGYGSPVMVMQPRPGASIVDYGGGMSSYSDGRTSCNTAYGVTSCY